MEADLQRLIDALSAPIRREILWLLRDREMAAGEIVEHFEVSGPTISQHLAVLRESELVEMRVDGNFRRYRARGDRLARIAPLIADDARWRTATDISEAALAEARIEFVVRVSVELSITAPEAFECFTDPVRYSEWMGVPVTIVDGRFGCTLEWGTKVRGIYDLVAAPWLIAMRWDFEDDNVPVPFDERIAYLRIEPLELGCRIEIHQMVTNTAEAEFMRAAWGLVLGRLKQRHISGAAVRRGTRAKRT